MRHAVAVGLLCVVGCGGGGGEGKPVGPTAEKEGVEWTHKELAEHLRGRGLDLIVAGGGGGLGEPTSIFLMKDGSGEAIAVLKTSPGAARESAGAFGDHGFAWGRFVIWTAHQDEGARFLGRIRKALP